jgi:hypothetical protein
MVALWLSADDGYQWASHRQWGRRAENRGLAIFERASGSVLHDRSDECETIMVPHPAQLLEPELSGDVSRVEAICSGLSLKARANLIALLGDFLNVAANRDLLCPEFQNGCCPNISYEPLNRLFSQLRQEDAARSTVSGGLRTPRCRPPRN